MGHVLILSTRRRVLLAIAAIFLVALAVIDGRLKSAPVLGIRPAETAWTLSSSNGAEFAARLTDTTTYRRSRAAAALPPTTPALTLRKETGIRPTPARWAFWLGQSLVAASTDDGWGMCLRPGVFLRIASALAGTYHEGEVYKLGARHYAWHEGFLLVSRSPAYIESTKHGKTVAKAAVAKTDGAKSASLTLEWNTGVLTLLAEENWPIRGHIEAQFSSAPHPLALAQPWDEPPLLSLSAVDPSDALDFVLELIKDLPLTEQFRLTIEGFQREFPEGWAKEGSEYSLALVGIDTTEPLTIPELVMVLQDAATTALPNRPTDAYPYEWGTTEGDIIEGWIRPWLGEKFSIAVAKDRDLRYLASQEPLMAKYLRRAAPGESIPADLVVNLDWHQISEALVPMLRNAAEFELLPRWNAADADERLLPYLDALAELGSAQLIAHAEEDTLRIEGHLGWATQ